MIRLDNENVVDLQIKNNIRGKGRESIYFILATARSRIVNTFAKIGSKVGQRKHGSKRIAELLINNGANVSRTNDAGKTALHVAANWGKAREILLIRNEENNLFCLKF